MDKLIRVLAIILIALNVVSLTMLSLGAVEMCEGIITQLEVVDDKNN